MAECEARQVCFNDRSNGNSHVTLQCSQLGEEAIGRALNISNSKLLTVLLVSTNWR